VAGGSFAPSRTQIPSPPSPCSPIQSNFACHARASLNQPRSSADYFGLFHSLRRLSGKGGDDEFTFRRLSQSFTFSSLPSALQLAPTRSGRPSPSVSRIRIECEPSSEIVSGCQASVHPFGPLRPRLKKTFTKSGSAPYGI
jgi:hypothetical protein